MKVFISSLISGFEPFRAAARSAVQTLRHEPVVVEDFGARSDSPQIACLQGVRDADMVVLILGERYGAVQGTSGLSPTHEEFREARDGKTMLLCSCGKASSVSLVRRHSSPKYRRGRAVTFAADFKTADELRDAVTRALHEYELANAAGPLDPAKIVEAAIAQLPHPRANQRADTPTLHLGIAGGPSQRLLRPARLEARELSEFIQREALFGAQRIFDKVKGTNEVIEGTALVLNQDRGAQIRLDESGSLLLSLPLDDSKERPRAGFGLFAIIEETVIHRLSTGLAFANLVLDHIDSTQRLAHVVVAATIDASDYLGWRTQAEQDASPDSGTMRMGTDEQLPPVHMQVPRSKLRLATHELAEDLMVGLRRQRTVQRRNR